MYKKISNCRICGNTQLECVLDLGEQMLTGVFARDMTTDVTRGPLRLVKCVGDDDVCGLLLRGGRRGLPRDAVIVVAGERV